MKVAIMQPYFLPYIGYWQLFNAVDMFVIYDNIKYTKKGWINRNRFLLNGQPETFTLPLKSDSDSLDINQRFLSKDFDRERLFRQIQNAYAKAIHSEKLGWIRSCFTEGSDNLFDYINMSISHIAGALDIKAKFTLSSELPFDHKQFKGQDKVLAICEHFGATQYINPIGGTELYNHADFSAKGIELKFLKSRLTPYQQLGNDFVPALSIIDPLLCVGVEATKAMLEDYDLV
jgi:hypothetical protein